MKTPAISLLLLLFSFVAAARVDDSYYLGAGMNLDTFNDDLPNQYKLDGKFRFGPTAGLKATYMWENIGFRTGAFAEWKKISIVNKSAPAGRDEIDLTAYYIAVPLNLQFNPTKDLSIFGGLNPRLLLAKTCEDCGSYDNDVEYLVNYYNFGASYEFSKEFSAEVSFQQAMGENFEDLGINTAQAMIYWKL